MDIPKVLALLNSAGYRVEFSNVPASDGLSAGPAASLMWENHTLVTRGVDPADALRGAVTYVLKEVEAKRIAELKRRGELHAELGAELARAGR